MYLPDVEYITLNLRDSDGPEVHGVRWDDDPILLAKQTVDICMNYGMGKVVKCGDRPAAVIGVVEVHPGVWQGLAYGTDEFRSVVPQLTRIARNELAPFIREREGHRLEVFSRANRSDAHRWLVYLGAMREGIMRKFGKDGADFYRFAWTKG